MIAAGSADVADPVFTDVDAFVADYLAQVVERRLTSGPTVGLYWWAHPEAISRVYALWLGLGNPA